ncbi:Fructose/tagatose bisphosphate aldolase [Citrobacter freundii]|nr:Fructose/tagatose bisphosphate aldolase [Citrobacter freundii]
MFADMKSMVAKAWREQYALLAINCMNLESARAAVRVAEKHPCAHHSESVSGASGAFSGPR